MKNCLHVVWMMICLLFVSSCKDDNNNLEEAEREAYRAEQDIAFQAKANEPDVYAKANEPDVYKRWVSPAGDGGYVFAKLLKEGNGKQIYYNTRLQAYYKGYLTDGTVFDQRLIEDGAPMKFAVSATYADYHGTYNPTGYSDPVAGLTIALQYMKEGDKYEVWIPQSLAYGSLETDDIPAYSTLIFEIEIVSVDEQAVSAN